ncbi:MAG: hypothetical protein HXX08_18900 [Chloroflexi bacterium]|uniref:Uncharacterized protein n=1 Tax=Candidatus Chlorohelix allophototropha TaxID=3003348 RepID=A0A8T7M703_9CHLR|nr:hypothetical protein [Chloroflexota bacterium]WJW69831.1 hypothetical protein OZ401_003461 [Chloroflexota bacterium L227-S17]
MSYIYFQNFDGQDHHSLTLGVTGEGLKGVFCFPAPLTIQAATKCCYSISDAAQSYAAPLCSIVTMLKGYCKGISKKA